MVPAFDPEYLRALRERAAQQRQDTVRQREEATARWQQFFVDAEIRATREALQRQARRCGGNDLAVLFDTEFLAVADWTALYRAVLTAALTMADSCDLQRLQGDGLHISAQHGFSPAFLEFFATVDTGSPTACGRALAAGRPVVVDDVSRSPIFAGHAALDVVLDSGSRAVASYPLSAPGGSVLGVLSLHHHRRSPPRDISVQMLIDGTCLAVAAGLARQ